MAIAENITRWYEERRKAENPAKWAEENVDAATALTVAHRLAVEQGLIKD